MQEAARRRWAAAKPDQPGGPGGPKSDLVDGGGSKKGPRGACNVPRPHWECTAIKRIKMAKGVTIVRPRPMRLTLPKALVMSAPLPASTDANAGLAHPPRFNGAFVSVPRHSGGSYRVVLLAPWASRGQLTFALNSSQALIPSLRPHSLPLMAPLLCSTVL